MASFQTIDPDKMYKSIYEFPDHMTVAIKIGESISLNKQYPDIKNVVVAGMGGSAIGGDVARVISQNSCSVPIIVNRSYNIPEWVDSHTLVLASSYSGWTEETLSAFTQCRDHNCPIIVLSGGGKITEYAKEFELDRVDIPTGLQPRAALGFSFSLILFLKAINLSTFDSIVK